MCSSPSTAAGVRSRAPRWRSRPCSCSAAKSLGRRTRNRRHAMTAAVECVVIGAGVVGLAVARALACGGREVLVLEKERWIGSETSSRNSEVIHAGLHYAKGSLKARFCVAGRDRLYAYCAERGIPHKRLGKLTVATREEELPILEGVWRKAERTASPTSNGSAATRRARSSLSSPACAPFSR